MPLKETPPPGWQERQYNDVVIRLFSSANHEKYYDIESETTSSTSFDSRRLNDPFKALYMSTLRRFSAATKWKMTVAIMTRSSPSQSWIYFRRRASVLTFAHTITS